eukprot:TRINITY_DN1496_c0_g1_i1.p1 TRINITY_DN1496_c0_g1~~TRINITY_DN1496_c0_g1_i1.p1  ORF type:complete len:1155 (+),score=559.92 TRINITY_DN1496_c0_g1_i1:114-3578(+)
MKKLTQVLKAESSTETQQKLQKQINEEKDAIKQQAAELQLTRSQLKDLEESMENQNKCVSSMVEAGRFLGDTLRNYSSTVSDLHANTPLLTCITKTSELQRTIEDFRSDLNSTCVNHITTPFGKILKGETKDVLQLEGKYEKTKANLETADSKLRQFVEKKTANVTKLNELESERESARSTHEETEEEALKTLTLTNKKLNFEVLARLVYYLEAQHDFYENSFAKLNGMMPQILEFRNYVETQMNDFETSTGVAVERILPPRSTRKGNLNIYQSPSSNELVKKGGEASDEEDSIPFQAPDASQDFEKKRKTVQEMVTAERSFLNNLKSIKQNYHSNLSKATKEPKNRLTEEEIAPIFLFVEQLYTLHSKIFSELDEALDSFPVISIGKIFRDKMAEFEIYEEYVSNVTIALDRLNSIKKNNRNVANLLKNLEKNDTSSGGSLAALLSLPLKRISQYEFWLENLYEATPTTDPEFNELEAALSQISELSENLMKSNTKAGEMSLVMGVQKRLTGFEENLVELERFVIKEGPILMAEDKGKEGKKILNLYGFLFNDLFIYASKAKMSTRVQAMRNAKMDLALGEAYVYKGHFSTSNAKLKYTENEIDGMKNVFQVEVGKNVYSIGSLTSFDKKIWTDSFEKALLDASNRRVFAVPLDQLMRNKNNEGKSLLPLFENCLNFIENNAINTEGIFRMNGSAALIEQTREAADHGKEIELKGMDPHAISGLVKLWMREIPDPLLTLKLYDNWMQASKIPEPENQIEAYKGLVAQLPEYNRFHLHYLLSTLKKVAANSEVNKMQASNLGIIFGPNLLYKRDANPFDTSDFKSIHAIVQTLLINVDKIFEGVEEEKRNFEEKEGKEIADRKEKESAEREKNRVDLKEAKIKKEEQVKQALELKERKEREEKDKVVRAEEEKKTQEQLLRDLKSQNELNQRVFAEAEAEREKLRLQREREAQEKLDSLEEARRVGEERLRKELEAAEKKKKADDEYRKLLEEEQEELKKKKEQQRLEEAARKEEERKQKQKEDAEREAKEQLEYEASLQLCAACNKAITDSGVNAMGKAWHEDCFHCNVCKEPISGSFNFKDGKLYCLPHFAEANAKICAGCSQVISGQFLKAVNKEWHQACFVCTTCKSPFTSGFFEKNGMPHCRDCASKIQ